MRKKTLALALTGALAISLAGVAYADINNSTFELSSFKTGPAKSGTKKKPKAVKLSLGVKGGTKDGVGQPSTSTSLKITLPKGIVWNGKKWPKSKRCSATEATQQQTDSVCPKGSKIGSGKTVAAGGPVIENLSVTAYVTTGGNLGLFIKGEPLPIAEMLDSKVKGRVINVIIPPNIQEPAPGIPSAILDLSFSLNAKAKIDKKTRGILESTGCTGKKWTLKFENIVRDGKLSDTASVPCKK